MDVAVVGAVDYLSTEPTLVQSGAQNEAEKGQADLHGPTVPWHHYLRKLDKGTCRASSCIFCSAGVRDPVAGQRRNHGWRLDHWKSPLPKWRRTPSNSIRWTSSLDQHSKLGANRACGRLDPRWGARPLENLGPPDDYVHRIVPPCMAELHGHACCAERWSHHVASSHSPALWLYGAHAPPHRRRAPSSNSCSPQIGSEKPILRTRVRSERFLLPAASLPTWRGSRMLSSLLFSTHPATGSARGEAVLFSFLFISV
jgi:hypothetical protein